MMRDWFENPRKTTRETIEQGLISSEMDIKTDLDEQKPQKMGENEGEDTQKYSQMSKNEEANTQKCAFPTITIKNVYDLICQNRTVKYVQIEENLGIDDNTVQRSIAWLKENGYINKEHSKVKGVWQLL